MDAPWTWMVRFDFLVTGSGYFLRVARFERSGIFNTDRAGNYRSGFILAMPGVKPDLRSKLRHITHDLAGAVGNDAGEGDAPVLLVVSAVKFHCRATAEGERGVAGVPKVVAEVILDHIALVAEAEDELPMAVMSVGLHDVPEDRAVADRHHRFRAELGLLT